MTSARWTDCCESFLAGGVQSLLVVHLVQKSSPANENAMRWPEGSLLLVGKLDTSLPVQAAQTAMKEMELEASLFDANLPNNYEAAAKKFSECLAVAGKRTRS